MIVACACFPLGLFALLLLMARVEDALDGSLDSKPAPQLEIPAQRLPEPDSLGAAPPVGWADPATGYD